MSIGEKLKQGRLSTDLTQEELAEKIGVSRQTISNWENGKSYPDIASIIILGDIYDMTLDSLLKEHHEIVHHSKESTNTTKSNQSVVVTAMAFFAINAVFHLIRHSVSVSDSTNTFFSIISMAAFAFLLLTIFASERKLRKIIERKTSNKTLMKIGLITLLTLIYFPLVLFTPEAFNTEFQITSWGSQAMVRVMSAFLWLVLTFEIYRKLKNLFAIQ